MILKSLIANQKSFRKINFNDGFNVVIAERTSSSSQKDSRNGLGKTLLLEIIDFCLGSNFNNDSRLKSEELTGWSFTLEMEISGEIYKVTRKIDEPNILIIRGDTSKLPADFLEKNEKFSKININEWRILLGLVTFNLQIQERKKYFPTYRNIISHLIRNNPGSFNNSFRSFPQEQGWSTQVVNAYLLGLNWEKAVELYNVGEKIEYLNDIRKAINSGVLPDYLGSVGDMEAEATNLEIECESLEKQIKAYKIHPEYHDIQKEANYITNEIHNLVNRNNINIQILEKYNNSIAKEKEAVTIDDLNSVYEEAGIVLSDMVLKRLDEVRDFHIKLIHNRKEFLEVEIKRLEDESLSNEKNIEELSIKRSSIMSILETHGALDEQLKIQERLGDKRQKANKIRDSIRRMNEIEEQLSRLRIERESTAQSMRKDYEERTPHIRKAISIFSSNSQFLYSEPGKLSIDIGDEGYKFKVEIKRADSQGISLMKIFCYDLMLAELNSQVNTFVDLVIHDSTLFDGVDERQVAKALELSERKTGEFNFQYICTLNSDIVPYKDFSDKFLDTFNKSVILTLTDNEVEGSLLGVRF
jgi:uncharacterized protein YydD (DUF2326 family)